MNFSQKNVKKWGLLCIAYLILGVILTWPLALNLDSQVPNNKYAEAQHTYEWGDHLQMVAGIAEHKDNLGNLITNDTIYNREFCFEDKSSCESDFFNSLKKVVFSAYWQQTILSLFFPTVVAYNLSVILSFVLTGIASFVYTRYLIKRFLGNQKPHFVTHISFIASLFAVLAPLRVHQMLVGHKSGFMLWILVFVMFLFEKYIFVQKGLKKYAIAASLLLLYLAINEQFLMLLGFGYILSRLIWVEFLDNKFNLFKSKKNFIQELLKYSWIPVALIVSYVFNLAGKLDVIKDSSVSGGRNLEEISLYSPQIYDLFAKFNLNHELNLYLGIGSVIILIGLVYSIIRGLKTSTKKDDVNELGYFVLIVCIIIIISLGTNTPFYTFLYENLPFFRFGRTPIKFSFILFPLIAVIFSILLSKLTIKWRKLNIYFFIALTVVIGYSYIDFKPISLSPLPDAIEKEDIGEKVLFIPYTQPDNFFGSIYEYYLSDTESVTINGYTPFIKESEEDFYEEYSRKLNEGELSNEEFEDFAERFDIDTVIILKEYFGKSNYDLPEAEVDIENIDKINKILENSNFEKIEDDADSTIWRK